MEVFGRNWLDLPPEIWDLIAMKIYGNRDFIVFSSVCKTWQLASTFVKHPESPHEFPLLVLSDGTELNEKTYEEEQKNIVQKRSLFNIFSSTSFDINLPEAYGKRCFAINFGWLLTLSMEEEIELLHPFSRRKIRLPNLRAFSAPHEYEMESFPDHTFITKAVISCSPNDDKKNDCIVFIIFDRTGRLAFTRIGDKYWTTIQTSPPTQWFVDIIYKNDLQLLYALDWNGVVFKCDINDEHPKVVSLTPYPPVQIFGDTLAYLVELGDDILLVKRIHHGENITKEARAEVNRLRQVRDLTYEEINDICDETRRSYYTTGFIMFKIEMEMDGQTTRYPHRWTQVEGIGNRALFLGDKSSLCLPTTISNNIKANCIYFTDKFYAYYEQNLNGGGYDTGIFNLQDKSIQRDYTSSLSFYCTPFWYV